MLLRVREHAVSELLSVRGGECLEAVERLERAVDAHLRSGVGGQVQIRAAQLDQLFEQVGERELIHQ
jgi:hypothetical protein